MLGKVNQTNLINNLKWSWASIDGQIRYNTLSDPGAPTLSTIESLKLYYATADIYGEILHANLVVRGQLLKCHDLVRLYYVDDRLWYRASLDNGEHTLVCRPMSIPDHKLPDSDKMSLYFWCILISPWPWKVRGLLLIRDGRARYKRCGVFAIYRDNKSPFEATRTDAERLLEDNFWKELKERTREREGARRSAGLELFKVAYLVGPPPKDTDNSLKAEDGEKEYDDFDGKDYVFSII